MYRCHETQYLYTKVIPTLLNTGFSIYYWHDITPKYALIIITLQIVIALGVQRSIILLSYTQENHFAYALIITLLFSSVFLINHFAFKVQAMAQNYFFIISECIFLSILFLNLVTLLIFIALGTFMIMALIIGITHIANYFRNAQMQQGQQQLEQQIEIGFNNNGLEIRPYSNISNKQYSACPICLQEFNENDLVSYTDSCRHFFHQQCLSTWLQEQSNCPYCRAFIDETL